MDRYLILGNYKLAIEQFNIILDQYKDSDFLWPNMDHLERVYYDKWYSLLMSDASVGEISETAQELRLRFPNSAYLLPIDLEMSRVH